MIKAFQKRNKWKNIVFGSILVLIALSMVLYLIPGFTGFAGDPTMSGVVAEVQGEAIQAYELQRSVFQFSQQNRIPAELMEIYRTQILEDMLMERATRREAERLGLGVSQGELLERLRQVPDLFPGGQFVGQQAYEDMVYTRFQVTPAEFERRFRDAILQEKLRSLVTDSVTVYPEEVRRAFQEQNEKLVVDYVLVETAAMREAIQPNDDTLQAYYQTNQARYQVAEKRAGRVILFDQNRIGASITIPEADLRRYYQASQNEFRVDEQVQVSHILLRSLPDPAQTEEVKKKAEDLLAQIKGGADFAELARENSEDPGSAPNGGDLGWIVRGQTVPEFEAAAFSLAPGTLSEVVTTTFGFHILKVAAHEQARQRPFEEVEQEIRTVLQQERAQAILPRQAEEAAAALRNAPGDAQSIAERLNAQALDFGPLGAGEPIPGIGLAQELNQEIFFLEQGVVGRPMATQTGYVVPLVTEIFPAHQGTFEEVKERVRGDYVDEQARERASARATELSEALGGQEQKDLKRAAQSLRMTVMTSEPVARGTAIPSVGNLVDFDPALFTKEVREVAGPFPTPGGHIILQIASREAPREEEFSVQQQAIEERLLQEKKQQAYTVFEDNLRSDLEARGEMVIYYDVLSRMEAGLPGEHPPYPHTHPPGF